jgi:hypothetical protein
VVSCSLEAFWSCYSILKFPWKKIIKKKLQQKKEKKQKEQKKQQQRRGFVCVFLSFVWWCFVITFVSRLCVLLHLTYQSLNNTLHARGLWWRVLIIIRQTCHGEEHKTKKKTSEEEQKGLAQLGCSCCKALTLNLLTRALTSSYLAPPDGEGNQQVSNLKEGVSVLTRESM